MAEPKRKLAFQKSTGSWVVVQPAGNGYEVLETLDIEDPSNWTGEAYDLASAHPKASAELKPHIEWYRSNMLEEPSGPIDENGKTTATPFAPEAAPSPSKITELPAVQIEGDPGPSRNAADFMRGAGQGASFGLGDEMSSTVEALAPRGAPRASGRGMDAPLMDPLQDFVARRSEALARERGANTEARERSPYLYAGGAIAGGLPAAIATAPAGGGAGLLTRAGQNALHGGALGALAGYGASEGGTDAELLEDAGGSAALGGALGAGGTIVGAGIGAAGRKAGEGIETLAEWAQKAGWRNRGVAPGTYGGELDQMTRQQGRDLVERIGQTIEKHGAHKRPESSMLPSFVPQGAGTYADTLTGALDRVGKGMTASIDDATAAGAQVDPKALAAAMRAQQAGHLAKGQPNNMAVAEGLDEIAADLGERTVNRGAPMSPREAWNYRNDMKPTAKLEGTRNVMPAVGNKGQAFREGRDVIRGAIEDALPPPQRAQFQEANTDYGLLKKAHNAAIKREARETGNQIMSINDPGMAAAGAVLGGAPGAAAGIFSTEALKRVGRDAAADVLGGTAKALRGASTVPKVAGELLEQGGADLRMGAPQLAPKLSELSFDDFVHGSTAHAQPEAAPDLDAERQADLERAARILEIDPNNKHAKRALQLITGHQ